MISKESLIKDVDNIEKIIYINEGNWNLAWENLYSEKQPFPSNNKNIQSIPEKGIYTSSLIYKFIILTEVFDNKKENDDLNKRLTINLHSLLEDGYTVVYKEENIITISNYKEYFLNKLKEYMNIALEKNKKSNEDIDYKEHYEKEIYETYNNLKKFI